MSVQRLTSKGEETASRVGSRKIKGTAPATGPKVLRIGILQNGKFVEERIIRKRDIVTIGQSEKNTFVVVSNMIPSRFEMFENRGGSYALQFTEAMSGRLSYEGEVKDLEELVKTGAATHRGKVYRLPLDEQARGKVSLGDSTILFQFVAPPPIQPRPQLPAAARAGIR